MKICGPEKNISDSCKSLGRQLGFEVPKGDQEDSYTFIGFMVKFIVQKFYGKEL